MVVQSLAPGSVCLNLTPYQLCGMGLLALLLCALAPSFVEQGGDSPRSWLWGVASWPGVPGALSGAMSW